MPTHLVPIRHKAVLEFALKTFDMCLLKWVKPNASIRISWNNNFITA